MNQFDPGPAGQIDVFAGVEVTGYGRSVEAPSVPVGGPRWPGFESLTWQRHQREEGPVDKLPPRGARGRNLPGAWSWLGPLEAHFGHQIVEFSTRMLAIKKLHPETGLLAGALQKARPSVPLFYPDLLEWFGLGGRQLFAVERPMVVESLSVSPQGECPWSRPPSAEYLEWLVENQNERIHSGRGGLRVFVSRAGQRVRIAGEAYLERILASSGWMVVRPENLPLLDQLTLYASAGELMFSEGSAVHALQLLGRLDCKVGVLARRPGWRLADIALLARGADLTYVDAAPHVLAAAGGHDGQVHDSSGLSVSHGAALTDALVKSGAIGSGRNWRQAEFEAAQVQDVVRWMTIRQAHLQSLQLAGAREEILGWRQVLDRLPATSRRLVDAVISEAESSVSGHAGDGSETGGSGSGGADPFRLLLLMETTGSHDWMLLSETLFREGDVEGAIEAVTQAAVRGASNYAWPWVRLSQLQGQLQQWDAALTSARTAVDRDAGSVDACAQLAGTLASLGQLDEAIDWAVRATDLPSASAGHWLDLANLRAAQGDFAAAVSAARAAIPLAGDGDGWPLLRVSQLEVASGRLDEALDAAEQAIGVDEQALDAHVQLKEVLLRLGRTQEALRASVATTQIAGSRAEHWLGLADLLRSTGDVVGAVQAARGGVRAAAQGDVWPRVYLSHLLVESGMAEEALQEAREAVELAPGSLHALAGLADAATSVGDMDTAARALAHAVTLPDAPAGHFLRLADLRAARGEFADAKSLVSSAIRRGSSPDAWTWVRLSQLHAETGHMPAALEAAWTAVTIDASSAPACAHLARLLASSGDLEKAVRWSRLACASADARPEMWRDLASMLRLNGDSVGADRAEREALRSGG